MKPFNKLSEILKSSKSAACLLVVENQLGILEIEPVILEGGQESECAELIGCLLDYTDGSIRAQTVELLSNKQDSEEKSSRSPLKGLNIDLNEIPPRKTHH